MTRAIRSYSVGDENDEDLAEIDTDIRGMQIADRHRAKLAEKFREDQHRAWFGDSHYRSIKRGNKSKRGHGR